MYSLNQIRKKLNDIADAHLQIQSFGFGETFDVNEWNGGVLQYPLMFVVPTGGNVSGKTLSVNFTLLFMDRINPDNSNKDEVSSDQLLIATDILAELSNPENFDYFTVSESNTLDPFTERFADDVTGWSADITIEVPYTRDRCSIPQVSTSSSSTSSCSPVTLYYSNGSSIVTIVNSGSTYTIPKYTVYKSNGSTVYAQNEFNVNTTLAAVTITDQGTPVTKEAGESYTCTVVTCSPVTVTDGLATPSSISVASGGTYTCTAISRIYAWPTPTGQLTSYATTDDAWVQQNYFNALTTSGKVVSLLDFFTLRENNSFGNNKRFTSITGRYYTHGVPANYVSGDLKEANGTSVSAANLAAADTAFGAYMIDHYTGLAWIRTTSASGLSWTNAIAAGVSATNSGFSDWFVPNFYQLLSVANYSINASGTPRSFYSLPFNNQDIGIWSSTTDPVTTTSAMILNSGTSLGTLGKTSLRSYFICRKHF